MQVAAIIATALIVAGFLLWLLDRRSLRKAAEAERSAASEGSASAERSGSAAALREAASPERSGSAAGAEKSASAASPAKAAPERSASAKEKEEPGWSSSQAAGAGAAGVVSSAGAGAQAPGAEPEGEACCGQHYSCEKDSLLTAVSAGIDYYEDEELDRYAGRKPDDYSEAEKDEFRDVMLTLLPGDLAGWGRSIQLRGINLPAEVRDEFLLLIDELRAAKTKITE